MRESERERKREKLVNKQKRKDRITMHIKHRILRQTLSMPSKHCDDIISWETDCKMFSICVIKEGVCQRSLYLPPSHSLPLSLYLPPSLSLDLSLSLPPSLLISRSLSTSLPPSHSPSLSLPPSPHSLTLSLPPSLPPSHSPSLPLSLPTSLPLS